MSKPPNILFITTDQQHWTTIGYNNSIVRTPNLDRLAAQGTIYDRVYCPNPTCSPTRSSIITGLYPSQHGCYSLGTKLPEETPTLGEQMQRGGYRSSLIGKAHFQPLASTPEYPSLESYPLLQDLEFWRKFHGPFYGFEHVELCRNHTDEAHVGQHYALWMEEKGFTQWRDYFRKPTGTQERQQWKWNLPEEFHNNTWIAERTNVRLQEHAAKGESFLLWASFFDPHPPYLISEPWDTMYDPDEVTVPCAVPGEHDNNPQALRMTQTEKPDYSAVRNVPDGHDLHGYRSHLPGQKTLKKDIAVYYGMVSCLDKYVGKILDEIDRLGLAENTLVVFTTDHGHYFGQHGLVEKLPFHYEDVIKLPFIVRWPGKTAAGKRSAAMQSLVDLTPTFLSVAGIAPIRGMTGVDQSKVWTGEVDSARTNILVENHHQPRTINVLTYVESRYKISVHLGTDEGELYDLQEDPGEVKNLWQEPAANDLKLLLLQKLIQADLARERVWMPRIAGA